MMPGPVVRAFPNEGVEFTPIVPGNILLPTIEIAQNGAHSPPGTGIPNLGKEWQRFLDAGVGFLFGGPIGKLRQPGSGRTPCRKKIAHHHVVKQYVMQTARTEPPADQMRVNVEHWDFGEGSFHTSVSVEFS